MIRTYPSSDNLGSLILKEIIEMATSKETTSADEPVLNVTLEVKDASKIIEKKLVLGKDGTIVPPANLYEELLPEGLTMDHVKRVQAHDTLMGSAVALALGNKAVQFFTASPEATEINLEKLSMGRNSLRGSVEREAHVPSIGGTPITKFCHVTLKYTAGSAGVSGAAFKRIRDHFNAEGARLWSEAK